MGILYILLYFIAVANGQAGPEEEECALNFDSPVYVCDDDLSREFIDTSDIEVLRHNETTSYMNGKLKLLKEFKECTAVEMIVEKTTGSRTEVMVTHTMCNLCAEIHPDSSYFKYLKYFKFPERCPFEPGDYEIVEFVTDSEDLPVNKANEARYQVTFTFYENTDCECKELTPLGCVKADFVIEPI